MRALLVRVAVDQAYGEWNGPVDPTTNEFVYVSIPDKREFITGLETPYTNVMPALAAFATGRESKAPIMLPGHLLTRTMHLDPDFANLTYGDTKDRARDLAKFAKDDLVVFYSGLRPCRSCPHRLIYAIVGLFRIDEVVRLDSVPEARWNENAHTRRVKRNDDDVIVRGQAGTSGRLKTCLPIGEWRDRAYRVTKDLLDTWGDLSCKDGFIQRSAVPPSFRDAARFLRWFESQKPEFIAENNPGGAAIVAPAVSTISVRKTEASAVLTRPKRSSTRETTSKPA